MLLRYPLQLSVTLKVSLGEIMKMLRIEMKHGEMIIPMEGKPFVDANKTQIIEIAGNMDQIDGEDLGNRIAMAMAALCDDPPDKED